MTICQLCDQWVSQLTRFELLLNEEFDVLKHNNADSITQMAERKLQLLTQLSETESALMAYKTPVSDVKVADWLVSQCPNSASVQQLNHLSEQIQRANQRNGMLLQSLMRLNEFGLNLFSGKIKNQDTYGAKGQLNATTPISSLTLATA